MLTFVTEQKVLSCHCLRRANTPMLWDSVPVDEASGVHWGFHEMLSARRCHDLGLSGERDVPWEWEGCDGAQVGTGWMMRRCCSCRG